MEIVPNQARSILDAHFSRYSTEIVCIFVSRHAIDYAGPSFHKASTWPYLNCVCLGPGSKQALMQHGIPNAAIISPLFPPYETESLLAHPFFSDNTRDKRHYWIFRGPPGRTLLQDTLTARGASIQEIALYDRRLPSITPLLRGQWEEALRDHNVTLVSSPEGLRHLMIRVDEIKDAWIKTRLLEQPILLPSLRVAQLAKFHGFRYITVTGSLETQVLLNALKTIFS